MLKGHDEATTRAERNRLESEVIIPLRNSLSQAQNELAIAKTSITTLNAQVEQIDQQHTASQAEIARLNAQIELATQARDEALLHINNLQGQLDAANLEAQIKEQRLLRRRYEATLSQAAIESLEGQRTTITKKHDLALGERNNLTSTLRETQIQLEDRSALLTIEKEINKQSAEMLESHVKASETSKKDAVDAAKKINYIKARLRAANLNKIELRNEIKDLEIELEAAEHLRKNAFVSRAIKAYLRNMKKSDTHGGSIELKAIATIFERNIVLIPSDSDEYIGEKSPLYIVKSTPSGSNEHATYQPMLPPGTINASTSAEVANMQVLPDSNSLFAACLRAAQVANGETLPHINSSLYVAAYTLRLKVCDYLSENDAYLREKFNAIADTVYQENNQGLNTLASELPSQELSSIVASIQELVTVDEEEELPKPQEGRGLRKSAPASFAKPKLEIAKPKAEEEEESTPANPLPTQTLPTGQSADSSVSSAGFKKLYDEINAMLLDVCNMERFIGNICKIITQHYPEKFDKDIQDEASRKESIASYKSLEDAGNYELLWESNFDISFNEHEDAVKNFLHGRVDVVEKKNEGQDNADNPSYYGVARRYVDHVESRDEHFGGPIEIQALADIYNWKINLRVFTGNASGELKYLKDFVPSKPKGAVKSISLVLVRAGTDKAAFYIEGKGDIETGSANLYKACTSEEIVDVKEAIIKHLRARIQPAGYFRLLDKPNDGITHYFDSYVISGEKGHGKNIKEFDLIPADDCECITEAYRLRAERITIFKKAKTLLENIVAEIASEIDGQTIHLSSLITRGELRATKEAKFKGALSFLAILQLASLATSAANAAISENYASVGLDTYNALQGTSMGVNIFSSILYYLGHLAKEASRARIVRTAQENLIVNLPFEKISTIHLIHSPSNTSKDKYTLYERPYGGVDLRSNWLRDQYVGLSFKLNDSDEELIITKEEYVPGDYLQDHVVETGSFKEDKLKPFAKDAHRSMYDAAPNMLAVLTMINVGLVIATLVNVGEQASMAANSTSPGNTTDTSTQPPTQFTVTTPNTANASIALTIATALLTIIHSSDSPIRVCEMKMSKALKAISRSYDNNQGRLSEELSELLQDFGVAGAFADALTTTPQMENIQRSIFKARQELREHIEALELDIKARALGITPEEQNLLDMLKSIEKMVNISNMEALHAQDRTSLRGLTAQVKEVVKLDKQTSTKQPSERKLSGAFLSRRPSIVGVSKRLSGFLGFSAAVTNKAVVTEATVPVKVVAAVEEPEVLVSRPQSGI